MPDPNGRFRLKASITALILAFSASPTFANENWKASEETTYYAISGTTPDALYQSIGQRGPQIGSGKTRVIAHTRYVLRWDRKFDHTNGACTILSAKPKLKITYTLPKPSQTLSPSVKQDWDIFFDGIRRHELVHGDHAKEMAQDIVRETVGLSIPNDPDCKKIKKELIRIIEGHVDQQRARGRAFDHIEMGNSGNIQRLVLTFLNGHQ